MEEIISKEELKKFLKVQQYEKSKLADFVYNKLKLKELNEIYLKHKEKDSISFVEGILSDLGIHFEISEEDLKRIPQKGGFILLSNHPFGALDGLIICKTIAEKRPDFKLMANFLLERIAPLKDMIFPVNPFETMKDKKSSVNGIRNALTYVREGHPLGIFPAGEVAAFKLSKLNVKEKEWDQIIKFILKCNVPVIPTYISGTNSPLFHALGLIHPLLRTAKLPSEIFNKKNKKVTMRIGHPIHIDDLKKMESDHAISTYLQLKSQFLKNAPTIDSFYKKPILGIKRKVQEITPAIHTDLLVKEIQKLNESQLLSIVNDYRLYEIDAQQCPNLMLELGRKREIAFRAVNEGTNKELDLDPFDLYYKHLIIWDEKNNALVGAYRLGKGDEIFSKYGFRGFYTHTLFRFKKQMELPLYESIELGRSFVSLEYQKKATPLFLLWKGIFLFMERNPKYKYLIGPVSISQDFTKISKSFIVQFSNRYLTNAFVKDLVKPRKNFIQPILKQKKIIKLVQGLDGDIDKLDKMIQETDFGKHLPVLLKKYVGLNAQITCFNVDKKFNNCLDGFLFLDYHTIPEHIKEGLRK
jgi:putative hemolysin